VKHKFVHYYLFGTWLFALIFAGIIFSTKPVHAQPFSGANDVAILGPNADIDDPVAHYRILATGGTPDVRVVGACLDKTAGAAGLRARIDGQDKNTNNDCSGNDLVFNNVAPNSVLRIDKINGQGHQPFDVVATNAPGVHVTQLANPNYGSSAFGNDGDNYGVNVWGTATFHFKVPCSVDDWTPIWIKWKDADVGQDNQTTKVTAWFQETDPNGNVSWSYPKQISRFQNNNKVGAYPDFVRPGYTYEWRWENVQSGNVIQHVLPFQDDINQPSCNPPKNNPNGWCQVLGVSNSNPYVGENVIVNVRFANTSVTTDSDGNVIGPGNDWILDTSSQHSGVQVESGEALRLNRIENGNSPPRDRVGAQLRWPNDYWTDRQFTVSSNTIGPNVHHFTIRKDNTGTTFGNLCSVGINWVGAQVVQNGCSSTTVYAPASIQYYLVFYDSAGNVVHNTGTDGGVWSGTNDFDTFNKFTYLYPHNAYGVNLYQWGSNALLSSTSIPVCMSVSCQTSLNADLEPGQTGSVSYGLMLNNFTRRSFPLGDYAVQAVANPGLSGSGSSPIALIPGGPVAYNATFNMTANYTGSVSAHLFWFGNNIDGPPLNINCTTPYTPNTRPSIKSTQGDVSAGGGFRYLQPTGAQQCTLTPNRYIAPITAGGDPSVGGIRTFASTAPYVSSSQFAAYALGLIHSPGGADNTQRYGFFSDSTNKFANKLTFANVGMTGGNLGGSLGGEFVDAHCAPDFYNETSDNLTPTYITTDGVTINPDSLPLAADGTGQFYYQNPGSFVKIAGTLSNAPAYPRKRVTIYVNGDALITNNITYGPWSFDLTGKTNNSPYLTIIAKGNIYVNFTVARMDGVYIAQPLDDAGITKGSFYTCSFNGSITRAQIKSICRNTLNVNGSVIAQHVRLLRSQGTLADGTGVAAENFNFIPSTVLGLPGFRHDSGAVITNSLDSLYSLPPVF
jgi:hypothetical protein